MMATLRVGVYNVLAQTLAKSDYFPYVLNAALKLKNRWPALQRVILELDADVLLLSELDRVDEYKTFFTSHGYELVFRRRGAKLYGNGIAYRSSKLRLVKAASLDMNDLADCLAAGIADTAAWHVINGEDGGAASAEAHFRKDSVGVFAALAFKEQVPASSPFGIVVACSHLYWDPSMAAVRSAQAASLLLGASDFAASIAADAGNVEAASTGPSQTNAAAWPILVGGDFNSQPGTDSHRLLIREPLPLAESAVALGSAGGSPASGSDAPGSGVAPLVWDTLLAPPPAPRPQAPKTASPPSASGNGSDLTAPAPVAPAPRVLSPGRRAWLERLSAFVGRAVSDVATKWSPSGGSPTDAPSSDGGPSSRGPSLVSAYARHAQQSLTLQLGGFDGSTGLSAVHPSGLPRVGMELKHGAPPVPLPLSVRLADAGDSTTGGLVATRSDGTSAPVASPLHAHSVLALDILAEPAMTTMTQAFTECLDYLLFTPRVATAASLAVTGNGARGPAVTTEVVSVLPMPTVAEVTKDGDVAVPSRAHPSDHFPLVAELRFSFEGAA